MSNIIKWQSNCKAGFSPGKYVHTMQVDNFFLRMCLVCKKVELVSTFLRRIFS